jgi:hypothetical protein
MSPRHVVALALGVLLIFGGCEKPPPQQKTTERYNGRV